MLSDLYSFLGMLGVSTNAINGVVISCTGLVGASIYSAYVTTKKRLSEDKYREMIDKKKEIEIKLFDEERERKNKQIEKDYEDMKIDKKTRELSNYNLVENVNYTKMKYSGIKVENQHQLLLGYDCDDNPVWGNDTNYIIAGTTGSGKTRKVYTLLLNWLANKQGNVYIGDLKGTDFKFFKDCKLVKCYVDDLVNIKEPVEAFKAEYERRKDLFNNGGYIDINDYNIKNDVKLKEFMLLIDEYADISDCYKDHNGKPIGVYSDIIQLARKCRALGGRIVLGTQRPSVDVICGTLKANCSIVGMKTINGLNSKIMIDTEGCERLAKCEALTVIDGNLVKIFSYILTDEMLMKFVGKLK